uniref:DNA-directed DNA polymerase n=1 Tax=Macrostomum lignano TaxID=282301 RepID=A0A1I8IWK3_9PLAT
MKDSVPFKASLRLVDGAVQKYIKARPVPFALRERLKCEIDKLVTNGVNDQVIFSHWALTHLATFLALVPLLICVLHTEAVITDSDDYRALPQDFNGLEKKASQRGCYWYHVGLFGWHCPPFTKAASDGALQSLGANKSRTAGRVRGAGVSQQTVDVAPSLRLSPPHLLHRLRTVGLGADDVACQLESPTAQQIARTGQAGAMIERRVGDSLVADLEGGAQQASVRRVDLSLERVSALYNRTVSITAWNSAALWRSGSPSKSSATPQILADVGNQTAEVDELLTSWKLTRLSVSASAEDCSLEAFFGQSRLYRRIVAGDPIDALESSIASGTELLADLRSKPGFAIKVQIRLGVSMQRWAGGSFVAQSTAWFASETAEVLSDEEEDFFVREIPFILERLSKYLRNGTAAGFLIVQRSDVAGPPLSERPMQLFSKSDECMMHFLQALEAVAIAAYKWNARHSHYPAIRSVQEEEQFQTATHCCLCEKVLDDDRHFHHDHLNGKFLGAACPSCNESAVLKRDFLPIFFHNFRGYDSHLLCSTVIGRMKHWELSVIAQTKERYMTLEARIPIESVYDSSKDRLVPKFMRLRFLDSFQFMASSLAQLVRNLTPVDCHYTLEMQQRYPLASTEVLLRKGVFPYSYVTSDSNLDEQQLPSQEAFANDLNNEPCNDQDYATAQRAWREFGCKTLRDYMLAYLEMDIRQLADVFEAFRRMSLTSDGLDPNADGERWFLPKLCEMELLDTSNYPKDHCLYTCERKARLGCVKDESDGTANFYEWILLRPKLYSFAAVNSSKDKRRAKGVQRSVVQNEICHADYCETLMKMEEKSWLTRRIASEHHELFTTATLKRALSFWEDKRAWLAANQSLPYGHWRLEAEKRKRPCPFDNNVKLTRHCSAFSLMVPNNGVQYRVEVDNAILLLRRLRLIFFILGFSPIASVSKTPMSSSSRARNVAKLMGATCRRLGAWVLAPRLSARGSLMQQQQELRGAEPQASVACRMMLQTVEEATPHRDTHRVAHRHESSPVLSDHGRQTHEARDRSENFSVWNRMYEMMQKEIPLNKISMLAVMRKMAQHCFVPTISV